MVNYENQKDADDRSREDGDRIDRDFRDEDAVSESSPSSETNAGENANPSIARRLTRILVENEDGDLLLQRSDREDGFLQWVRALDLQVMGACRADERLKPFLKLNVSSGMAEDRLLAHLSQHFEASEVGILARCLCVPLLSVRVGKINKNGTILSPTSIRGNLCLTLLPTSDLRISFNGDDGSMERLATFSTVAQSTAIDIEEISADKSGRSFLVKISDTVVHYFWCCEKSRLLGDELLRNMKDLLVRKPSLSELTGICESRLNCFASHLRAYLAGSMVANSAVNGFLPVTTSSHNSVASSGNDFPQSSSACQKITRSRQYGSQGSKTNPIYQGSLSPKSSPFKDGQSKALSNTRNAAREKLKRRAENYASCVESLDAFLSSKSIAKISDKDKPSESEGSQPWAELSFLDALGKSTELRFSGSEIQDPSSDLSHFSPHYCWCPPVAPTLQYTLGNSSLPVSSAESLSLPPLSSLLSTTRLLTSKPSLNITELPPFDFPTFLPEPLVRLPTSQQIPTFTPLVCDPIVHIPVIDVCSSGQGYLVSAGPAMSTTIPPLNPNLVDPLPDSESVLEKSARETLRMLINSSSQPSSQLLDVLPSVLSSNEDKQHLLASTGSRGLYTGTIDIDVLTHNLTPMGLALFSEKPLGSSLGKRCASRDDLIDPKEKPSSSGPSSFDEGID